MKRDNSTREEASARLDAQLPISTKLEYADRIVENSGTVAELESEVTAFVEKLNKQTGGWRWLISWLIPPAGLAFAAFTLGWRLARFETRRKKKSQ
jgi:dephospho-CoA kinase